MLRFTMPILLVLALLFMTSCGIQSRNESMENETVTGLAAPQEQIVTQETETEAPETEIVTEAVTEVLEEVSEEETEVSEEEAEPSEDEQAEAVLIEAETPEEETSEEESESIEEETSEEESFEEEASEEASEEEMPEEFRMVEPATSQSFAVNISIGEKVYGKYTEGYAWLSFTTGDAEDATYSITLINKTTGSKDLYGYVFDEFGGQVIPSARNNDDYYKAFCVAEQRGNAATGSHDDLKPNTTYYVRLSGGKNTRFALWVSCSEGPEQKAIPGEKDALSDPEAYFTGSNQDDAPVLGVNVFFHGKLEGSYAWAAFTTGPDEDATYSITLENLTVGSKDLYIYVFDRYGYQVIPTARNNSDYYKAFCVADQNGTANTGSSDALKPDTTYYIRISGTEKTEYILRITAPEDAAAED